MKTKTQKFIWATKVAWWNKHNYAVHFMNFFLQFFCNRTVGWKNKGWNSDRTFYDEVRVLSFGNLKLRFGLIRIRKNEFIRDLFLNHGVWLIKFSRNRNKIRFNKWFLYHIKHYIDLDFMLRLYLPFYQWYAYIKFAKAEAEAEVSEHVCLSDPMNGCPEDFAADFNRAHERMYTYADKLNCPDWFKRRVHNYFHKKAWNNYYKNPAPWDEELENDEEFQHYYNQTINSAV